MALYPRQGALLNHDSMPNCWTLFEAMASAGGGVRHALVLRTLCAVREGTEVRRSRM